MAITVTLQQLQKLQIGATSPYGTIDYIQVAQLVYDNSYPNGGYPITPSSFNLNGIYGLAQIGYGGNATPTLAMYDAANKTLRVYAIGLVTGSAFPGLTATTSAFVEVAVGSAAINNVSPTFMVLGS